MAMKLRIEDAKDVALRLGADAVIVLAFKGRSLAAASYGKDRATCRAFAAVCDRIVDDIEDGTIEIPGEVFLGVDAETDTE